MEDLKLLIEQLKAAGITPIINLTVTMDRADVEGIKALRSSLQAAGITPAVQIQIGVSGASSPGPAPAPDTSGEKSFTVVVSDDKANCMTFTKLDKAGKPIMEIREPRIHLFRGDRLSVSAEHKVSDKDAGDGTVIGTGGIAYYFIIDCQTKPEAKGLFVRQAEVRGA